MDSFSPVSFFFRVNVLLFESAHHLSHPVANLGWLKTDPVSEFSKPLAWCLRGNPHVFTLEVSSDHSQFMGFLVTSLFPWCPQICTPPWGLPFLCSYQKHNCLLFQTFLQECLHSGPNDWRTKRREVMKIHFMVMGPQLFSPERSVASMSLRVLPAAPAATTPS